VPGEVEADGAPVDGVECVHERPVALVERVNPFTAPAGGARERIAAHVRLGAIDDRIGEKLHLHEVVGADAVTLEVLDGRVLD